MRAKTGAAPSEPIATVIGARSTIAGVMKLQRSGASTTFKGVFKRYAIWAIFSFVSSSAAA